VTAAESLDAIAEQAWQSLIAAEPYYAAKAGIPVERLPRGDLALMEELAAAGRRRLEQLRAIPDSGLDRTQRLTKATLTWLAEADLDSPAIYRSMFGIAPYQLSALAMAPDVYFKGFAFDGTSADERYLTLVSDLASGVEAQLERLELQAAAGWRLPRPALPTVRATVEGIGARLATALLPDADRLAKAKPNLRDRIAKLIEGKLTPAFQRLRAAIGDDYEAKAPTIVGMGQYPGGQDAYRKALNSQLSWPATPEEIHAKGLEEIARLTDVMATLRSRAFKFDGDEATFHERLRSDPRAHAASPEALEAIFRRHIERMLPRIPSLFERTPKAESDVARLAPELEAGMTYGHYRPPMYAGDKGIYYYSGFNLENRLQMNAAPLIFHELLPGHHFHIARQTELTDLPKIRREIFPFNAFNEGWAEYAASLGEEQGLYDDPYDLYGWLTHQRFVAQRLVVDTGMNALGWPLKKARAYMSANTLEGPAQVDSETLRYSTDLPGQALGYRWGFLKMRELRKRAQDNLGDRFDIRRWHEAILSQGGLPMTVLDQSLAEWEATERGDRA
jgi:uncharacterized protein (DUF885 family)